MSSDRSKRGAKYIMFDLTGKKALITGSTQGIGQAIAICLAEHGATVVIHGSSSIEKCRLASKPILDADGQVLYAIADLSCDGCAKRLYDQTGNVDILVLNASIQIRKKWKDITPEEFDKQMHVNFKSSLEIIQLYEPFMRGKGWGRIVTIGSVQQVKPHRDMLVYAASKQAQMSMAINLSKQLAPYGITVNNLSPGVIDTPRNTEALSNQEYMTKIMNGIPCGYAGVAEDCTGAALLLCSKEGRYITGIDLIVDGGMHL